MSCFQKFIDNHRLLADAPAAMLKEFNHSDPDDVLAAQEKLIQCLLLGRITAVIETEPCKLVPLLPKHFLRNCDIEFDHENSLVRIYLLEGLKNGDIVPTIKGTVYISKHKPTEERHHGCSINSSK